MLRQREMGRGEEGGGERKESGEVGRRGEETEGDGREEGRGR